MSKNTLLNKNVDKGVDNVATVRKEIEYLQFIGMVSGGVLPDTWELTAEALGVHPNTIKAWKKLPEFREAKLRGINECLAEMRRAGKDDWRQWEASLRLLGVKTTDQPTTNIQVNVPVFQVMSDQAKEQLEKLYEGLNRSNN